MNGLRRFVPLMVAFAIALAALVVRLYEVQVGEHGVWAREALGLVRESSVLPARRGPIVDRNGIVVVEDEEDYVLDFVWREFRREHPVGAVAQACSQLFGRPVGLEEADANLLAWGQALVQLSPDDLEAFARGEALPWQGELLPALASDPAEARRLARATWRRTRAGDARFYIESLLGVTSRETYALRQRDPDAWDARPFLQRIAAVREAYASLGPNEAEAALLHDWSTGLQQARERLAAFAERLAERRTGERRTGGAAPAVRSWSTGSEDPQLTELLQRLEGIRTDVEDAVADSLFLAAAGFPAARLSTKNLERLDLEWLRVALVWDDARIAAWRARRGARAGGPGESRAPGTSWLAARVYTRLQLARERAADGASALPASERVLLELLRPFAPGGEALEDWRTLAVPAPVPALERALEGGLRAAPEPLLLPTQRPAALASRVDADAPRVRWSADHAHLERVLALGSTPQEPGDVGRLLALATRARDEWSEGDLEPIERLLGRLDHLVQAEVARLLGPAAEPAAFEPERLAQALEPRDHLLKDHSLRPRRLLDRPDYDLIAAITRYPTEHAGFVVRPRHTRRWRSFDDGRTRSLGVDLEVEPRPLLTELVGAVRSPSLIRVMREQDELERARAIEAGLDRDEAGFDELARIYGSTVHASEKVGGSGLEAHFDAELRGRHGFRESIGLAERGEDGFTGEEPPQDGLPLRLTVDLDLQRAALAVLERPELPSDPKADLDWYRDPVGALVLARVDGEVLAAASVPTRAPEHGRFAGDEQDGRRRVDGERLLAGLDRTLRMRGFQPPGSTMKPLVALWALERGWVDADGERQPLHATMPVVACGHPSGWGKVACNIGAGHSMALHGQSYSDSTPDITLHDALPHSCNAYFAWLGHHLLAEEHRELAATFGLGESTGVRRRPGTAQEAAARRGAALVEESRSHGFLGNLGEHGRQLAGNGLGVLQVTPMQLARAYAGLATGTLPEMRLVSSAGGRPVPAAGTALPFAPEHLATVRALLGQVVTEGSAKDGGLGVDRLGFRFACKTGSADITSAENGRVPDGEGGTKAGVRKHTWIAGWFPAERPQYVAVLLVHNTAATSSHGAVYVMSQFLQREEVRALVR